MVGVMSSLRSFARVVGGGFFALLHAVVYVVFGVLLVGAVVVASTGFHVWSFARADERAQADTIFVLGAAQYDGVPSKWFAARLDHAAELYRQGVAPTIVTVGGKKVGDRFTEGAAGRSYLVEEHGVPEHAVVAIEEGSDTLSSAEAFRLVSRDYGWMSSVVVTDAAHALRSTTMVRDQGFAAWSSPTRTGPSVVSGGELARSILHETGGLLFYRLTEK